VVTEKVFYAENQAKRHVAMTMKEWVQRLDSFQQFNEYAILKDAGHISSDIAKKLAETQALIPIHQLSIRELLICDRLKHKSPMSASPLLKRDPFFIQLLEQ
jgi:hypothetical protein